MSVFETLAEPNRRRLLDALLGGPQPVSALVRAIDMSQPVVSKHLKILRNAGLVAVEPAGQQRLYSIRAEPLAELDAWLEPYRAYWSDKLADLERHLDTMVRREDP